MLRWDSRKEGWREGLTHQTVSFRNHTTTKPHKSSCGVSATPPDHTQGKKLASLQGNLVPSFTKMAPLLKKPLHFHPLSSLVAFFHTKTHRQPEVNYNSGQQYDIAICTTRHCMYKWDIPNKSWWRHAQPMFLSLPFIHAHAHIHNPMYAPTNTKSHINLSGIEHFALNTQRGHLSVLKQKKSYT